VNSCLLFSPFSFLSMMGYHKLHRVPFCLFFFFPTVRRIGFLPPPRSRKNVFSFFVACFFFSSRSQTRRHEQSSVPFFILFFFPPFRLFFFFFPFLIAFTTRSPRSPPSPLSCLCGSKAVKRLFQNLLFPPFRKTPKRNFFPPQPADIVELNLFFFLIPPPPIRRDAEMRLFFFSSFSCRTEVYEC